MITSYTIISSIRLCISILEWVILFKCLLSWVPIGDNVITRFIDALTEPLLKPIRDLMYKSELFSNLRVDFSPMILIVILTVIEAIL